MFKNKMIIESISYLSRKKLKIVILRKGIMSIFFKSLTMLKKINLK